MKINKFIQNKKNYHQLSLGIVIFLGLIFRFYNFPVRYGFDFDAARDSLAASLFAEKFTFPLIGASSSAAPFNFGPWYYYALILFEKITPLYGSWILVGIVSTICIYVFYKIGEKIENNNFGLLLSALVAFSPSQIILSTTLSNPSLIPLFSALTIFSFVSYLKNKNLISAFLLSLFLGLGVSIHFQMIGFLVFPVLIILFYGNRIKTTLSSITGFIIPFLPIVLYDLNNGFYNLKGLFFYFTASSENVYVANRWLFYLRDFWPKFWSETLGVNLLTTWITVFAFGFLILFLGYKRLIRKEYLLIFTAFIFNFILLRYFPSQKPIYYLYFLQSFVLLFSGMLIFKLFENKKLLPAAITFLILIFSFMIKNDLNIINSESSNREVIKIRKDLLIKFPKDKFNIYVCSENRDKGMALTYLLNKKRLISEDGKKILLEAPNCDLKNTEIWWSIISKTPEELKSMQVHKSY